MMRRPHRAMGLKEGQAQQDTLQSAPSSSARTVLLSKNSGWHPKSHLRLLDFSIDLDVFHLWPDEGLESRPFLEKGQYQRRSTKIMLEHPIIYKLGTYCIIKAAEGIYVCLFRFPFCIHHVIILTAFVAADPQTYIADTKELRGSEI